MKNIVQVTLLACLLLTMGNKPTNAQDTGSFDTQISFNGNQRHVSVFVPEDYDSTGAYKLMIGLHGLGQSSDNYRDALINQLNWDQHFDSTIFVFPDGGDDRNSDFYAPEGDQAVIDSAIAYAQKYYSIDTSKLVLQGFSLGGRSALKYGLENTDQFWGLLLNTPALQGILDAKNDSATSLVYPYEKASEIPIFIVNGGQDVSYVNPIDTAYQRMIRQNGLVEKNTIQTMGHRVPPFSEMDSVYHFFENKRLVNGKDLDVVALKVPGRVCQGDVPARVLVRNRGADTMQSLELQYEWEGQQQTQQWTGELGSYEHAEVALPGIQASDGLHGLKAQVTSIDGGSDTLAFNNTSLDTFDYAASPVSLPVEENFDNGTFASDRWVTQNSGRAFSWYFGSNGGFLTSLNTILLFYTMGIEDHFLTPVMDFEEAEAPHLAFDVAYNYHRYNVGDTTINFADTLMVGVSTDCGATFETVFKKGGEALATYDQPENPQSLQEVEINPGPDNWRKVILDLSDYAGENGVTVRFSYISGQGGAIAMDSIEVRPDSITTSLEDRPAQPTFSVYPNPASEEVVIDGKTHSIQAVQLTDNTGRQVLRKNLDEGGKKYRLDIRELPEGVYLLGIETEHGIYRQKLLKTR